MKALAYIKIFIAAIAFLAALLILWINLGEAQIRMWDEATYALNSLDMYFNGTYLLNSTNGIPDFYNSQPQLVVWAQTFSLHLFGISEFSIRFPSALAASILVLFLLLYFRKKLLLAALVVLILVSIPGYVCDHVTRTGDMDSMLILWMTIAIFSWYNYFAHNSSRYRMLFFICLFLGIMTKGIAIFMMMPGVLLSGLLINRKHNFYKDWRNYFSVTIIALALIVYYSIREQVAPGYLADVFQDSFGRFFGNVHQWDTHSWYYYLDQIWNRDFVLLRLFIPIIILSFFVPGSFKKFQYYLLIVALSYLSIITLSSTKTYWYDAPMYSILAALSGLSIYALINFIASKIPAFNLKPVLLFACIIALSFTSLKSQYNTLITSEIQTYEMEMEGLFLRHLFVKELIQHPYTVLKNVRHPEEHLDQIMFYIIKAKTESGIQGFTAIEPAEIKTKYVIVCQEESKQKLSDLYAHADTIYKWKQGALYLKLKPTVQVPLANY